MLCRIGTSERLSAPPPIAVSTCPARISEAQSTIAARLLDKSESQVRYVIKSGCLRARKSLALEELRAAVEASLAVKMS